MTARRARALGRGRRGRAWYRRWDAVLDASRALLPVVSRRRDQQLLQRPRPPRRGGRADQVALIYDSPVTSTLGLHLPRAARRGGRFAGVLAAKRRRPRRPGRDLHADDPRDRDRHAGLRPHRRSTRGLRRVRVGCAGQPAHRRAAQGRPDRLVRHRGHRVVPWPMLDEAIELAVATPDCCIVLQRPEAKATLMPGRDHDWRELAAVRWTASRFSPPIRSTSLHLGHHR